MSNYPATPSYGMGYGAQDQSNPPYLPLSYQNQYIQQHDGRMDQAGMPSSYDASMSTYGYNNGMAPFGASVGVPPQPIYHQGWNQDAASLAPYAPAHVAPQYSGYSATGLQQQNAQYYGAPSQHTYQQNQPSAVNYDEGEVSEGEFEGNGASTNKTTLYAAGQYRPTETAFDTAQQSVYPGIHAGNSFTSRRSSNNYNYPSHEHPRSKDPQPDAYSPYDPAKEYVAHGEGNETAHIPNHTNGQVNGNSKSQNSRIQGGATKPFQVQTVNVYSTDSSGKDAKPDSESGPSSTLLQTASSQTTAPSSSEALLEARKQAEKAILNLWPYEVRFQQYIDEGFDESIVGGLFDRLKMSRNSSKITGSTLDRDEISVASEASPSISAQSGGQQSVATSSATKPAVLTDKEKTLQSKMEALRKSREERAQKAAAKNSTKTPLDAATTQSLAQSTTMPNAPKEGVEQERTEPQSELPQFRLHLLRLWSLRR